MTRTGVGPYADIAERIGVLQGEGAFEIAAATRARLRQGRDVISLAIGEPDFPAPPVAVDAAQRALRDGADRYGPPEGLLDLRLAITAALVPHGLSCDPHRVVVTPGAKAALAYAVLCIVRPGDEVLVPDPGFPIYASLVRFAGGIPVPYAVRPDGDPLPDDLTLARFGSRVSAVIVNSPHNPTGAVASAAGLARFAETAWRYGFTILSDEVYARLIHSPDEHDPFAAGRAPSLAAQPGLQERTIIIDGFSKTYAMTGWRLGYGFFPVHLARAAARLAVNVHSCVPAFVQHAGLAVLQSGDELVRERRIALRRRRDAALEALRTIPGVSCAEPGGAFYVFPDISRVLRETGETTAQIAERLLQDGDVAVVPGSAFGEGGEGALRLALTVSSERIVEGIERVGRTLARGPAAPQVPGGPRAGVLSSGGAA